MSENEFEARMLEVIRICHELENHASGKAMNEHFNTTSNNQLAIRIVSELEVARSLFESMHAVKPKKKG